MFREFFRAKFLLAAIICLFYVRVCVKPETPRPSSSTAAAAARGSGARGWVAWVGATAGNTWALSGGRGYWAAGGQWVASTT